MVWMRPFITNVVSQYHGAMMKKQTRMILALDETDGKKALDIVGQVAEYIDAVKTREKR